MLDTTVQMAIMAFRESWLRISKVMGWGKLEGDLWEIKLSKIYSSPPQARGLSRRPLCYRRRAGSPSARRRARALG